jgi:PKD repeat protein
MFTSFQGITQNIDATLHLDLDCWGDETSWTLKDWDGNVVYEASVGTYEQDFSNGQGTQEIALSLEAGECYTFRLIDSNGDGMIGSIWNSCNVNGDYSLVANGDTLAKMLDPAFSYSTFKQFCVHPGCTNPEANNYVSSATVDDGSCILPPVQVDFTFEQTKGDCENAWYTFNSSSLYATGLVWEFENGTPSASTSPNPTVQFPSGTIVTAKLTAGNSASTELLSQEITIPHSDIGTELSMFLEPDCFASDISWSLADSEGNVLRSVAAGTYSNSFPEYEDVITETFCLPNGCYTFTIYDEYGDGLEGSELWQCNQDGDFYFENSQNHKIAEMDNVDFGSTTKLEVCVDGLFVWVGGADDTWGEDDNWQNGDSPGNDDDVYVLSPGNPVILDGIITVRNLIIAEGTNIQFADEDAELKLKGDLINHGDFNMNTGTVKINGNTSQKIKGANNPVFTNILMDTNGSLELQCDVDVKGNIEMKKGTFHTNGKMLTLKAGADYYGTIGEIKSAASFLGDTITVEQYYPAGPGGWRMVCTPLNGVTFDQFNDDIPKTGIEGGDYPSADNPWANIRYYNETYYEGDESDLNVGFTGIQSISDTIDSKRGYFIYFLPSPTTIDITGAIPTGTVDIDLSYTDGDGTPGNDGWNLVANPFPSAIDWDKESGFSKVGMSNSIYAFDPSTGQYCSYVNGINIGNMDNRIAPGQAFWVKAVGPTGHLRLTEAAKTKGHGAQLRTADAYTETTVRIRLSHDDISDECVFGFNQHATEGYDENIDAYKFYPTNAHLPSIAVKSENAEDEVPLSISMMPIPEDGQIIPLEVKTGEHTEMYISNAGVDSFNDDVCLTLEDTELDKMVPMNQGDTYTFTVTEKTTDDRFVLHLAATLDVTVLDETCPESDDAEVIAQGFGEAPWNFTWTDEMGMLVKETVGATSVDVLENANPGYYEIMVTNENEYCNTAYKVVEVKAAPAMQLEATGYVADCNLLDAGSLYIDLAEHFDWDLTIEDYYGQTVKSFTGLNADTLIGGLQPEIYSVHAFNICGAEIDLWNINLRDANAAQAGISINQTTTSLEEGGVIQFSSTSLNADKLVWNFGDGNTDTTSFMTQHAYDSHGTFLATVVALNEFCSDTAQVEITITMGGGPSGNNSGVDTLARLEMEGSQDQIQINIGDESIKLEIVTESDEDMHIAVFNMAGQLVIDEKKDNAAAENFSLDISALATGVYTLHVSSSNTLVHSETFVKN